MEAVECVVAGAGVIGLAIARNLALAGREVLLLEATSAIGTGISSRNSEVIHAGIYYPAGSLMAQSCVAGKQALYAYAAASVATISLPQARWPMPLAAA
jgi:L-2-hydroxyglutarate oxidase LhgO